jgi:hypothetical protein
MVLADSRRLPLIPRYLGTPTREPDNFRLQDFHLLWFPFPRDSANRPVFYSPTSTQFGLRAPHNTTDTTVASFTVSDGLGSFPFARHYSGNRSYFFFLGVLRYFNSPRLLCRAYEFSAEFPAMKREGLPHSEITGSKVVSTYPVLIAGYHVLHRLPVPRHPSCALSNLTKNLLMRTHVLRCINTLTEKLYVEDDSRCRIRYVWSPGPKTRHLLAPYRQHSSEMSKNSNNCQLWMFNLQLSIVVELRGIEPLTSWLQTMRSPS